MRLPCCMNAVPDNIIYAKALIDQEEKKGRKWTLIKNLSGKLEFVPTESIELIKRMMPNITVL